MKPRDAREQIVGCAHALWDRGLVTGSSGNISARLDDGDLLITPTRKALGFLRKSDLVRIDMDGKSRKDGKPSSEWRLHVAAYAARTDIEVVVHTHPTFCVVWSGEDRLFPRETVASMESLRAMKLVPFHPNGTQALADATRDALADGTPLALLARHGLVAVSREMEDAYVQTDLAEECAKVAYFSGLFSSRA
ncbi:MAG TPA: class II aldolase/adducin family protein [Candidatus Acidoferrales bacterium]|nr:class II aldolase/adducin family protein [Candidatus Acidoferrales bacterium]